jgi:photosystem II stability/assembly factor-like uncharacterized protein
MNIFPSFGKSLSAFIILALLLACLPAAPLQAKALNLPTEGILLDGINPSTASNNAGTPVTITGSGFTALTTAALGSTSLNAVYLGPTVLTATVPWGMKPGIYDLKITDPSLPDPLVLPNAFTVTLGLGKWINNGPFGGQVLDLIYQPGSAGLPDRLYACVINAGLFVSTDSGANWSMLINTSYPMRLKISPANPQYLYLNTNNGFLRSLDGGLSWSEILPAPGSQNRTISAFPDPADPHKVFISAVPQINQYNNSNYETLDPGGLYVSTDHGDTYSPLSTTGLTDLRITDLVFDPQDAAHLTILAGTLTGKLFLSADGGLTWNQKGDLSAGVPSDYLPARVDRLAFNPLGHEAWAVRNNPFLMNISPVYFQAALNYSTWKEQPNPNNMPGWVRPWSLGFGLNRIWLGAGQGYTAPNTTPLVWTALTPGGLPVEAWRNFEFTTFAFGPSGSNTVFAGTRDHGVYKSTDGGLNWAAANHGLAGINAYALAVSPDNLDEVYAVSQSDGLAKSLDGGRHWTSLNFKRSGYPWIQRSLLVDPFYPNNVYLGSQCPTPSGTPPATACLTISRNRGATWSDVLLTPPAGSYQKGEVFAIAANPAVPGWLVAGATFYPTGWMQTVEHPIGAFYVSANFGQTWTQANTPPVTLKGSYIITFDPAGQVAYAGTDGSGLWRSLDRGQSWAPLASQGCPLASGSLTVRVPALTTHPLMGGLLLAACEVYDGQQPVSGGLYRSLSYGSEWAALQSPETGIKSLQIIRSSAGWALYAGGWGGAARSLNYGDTWSAVDGLPAAEVHALAGLANNTRSVVYLSTNAGMASSADRRTAAYPDPAAPGLLAGGTYALTEELIGQLFLPIILGKP